MSRDPLIERAVDRLLGEMAPPTSLLDDPGFRKWFDGSRVVDRRGNPLVVYHGTGAKFSVFDRTDDIGFHFATDPSPAKDAASWSKQRGSGEVRRYVLRIVKPATAADWCTDEPEELYDQLRRDGFITRNVPQGELSKAREDDKLFYSLIRNLLGEGGYDGLYYKNEVEYGNAYVAFDAKQILPLDLSVHEATR